MARLVLPVYQVLRALRMTPCHVIDCDLDPRCLSQWGSPGVNGIVSQARGSELDKDALSLSIYEPWRSVLNNVKCMSNESIT